VGDFIWVAITSTGQELVLNYIIERKQISDLQSSILDGRYYEQKYRLLNCGLKQVVYLVEGKFPEPNNSDSYHHCIPKDTIESALISTSLQNIIVKRTININESLSYLKQMTNYLIRKYKNKSIDMNEERLITFEQFNNNNSKTKNLNITHIFAKQLIRLYRMSSDKAMAIMGKYPTPAALLDAYEKISQEDRPALLESLSCGSIGRKLGTQLSNFIYQLYYSGDYDLLSTGN